MSHTFMSLFCNIVVDIVIYYNNIYKKIVSMNIASLCHKKYLHKKNELNYFILKAAHY